MKDKVEEIFKKSKKMKNRGKKEDRESIQEVQHLDNRRSGKRKLKGKKSKR